MQEAEKLLPLNLLIVTLNTGFLTQKISSQVAWKEYSIREGNNTVRTTLDQGQPILQQKKLIQCIHLRWALK